LLLTALSYALQDLNGNRLQGITLEGHGREVIDSELDHSHTVGWYTTMYPVRLEVKDSLRDSIRSIKECLRKVPRKGIGFGSYALLSDSGYGFEDLPLVSFNYLGQLDVGSSKDWQIVSERSGVSVHRSNKDHNVININGFVSEGKLRFSIVTTY